MFAPQATPKGNSHILIKTTSNDNISLAISRDISPELLKLYEMKNQLLEKYQDIYTKTLHLEQQE